MDQKFESLAEEGKLYSPKTALEKRAFQQLGITSTTNSTFDQMPVAERNKIAKKSEVQMKRLKQLFDQSILNPKSGAPIKAAQEMISQKRYWRRIFTDKQMNDMM